MANISQKKMQQGISSVLHDDTLGSLVLGVAEVDILAVGNPAADTLAVYLNISERPLIWDRQTYG